VWVGRRLKDRDRESFLFLVGLSAPALHCFAFDTAAQLDVDLATVTSTFQHPVFGPNVQKIAQMKLKSLMPSADNPLGGASGIVGNLLGQKSNPNNGQSPNAPQQPNPVNQVHDILGRKKKQTADQPSPKQ
jgi:hypothetical protein